MKYNFEMIWNGYTVCGNDWGMVDEIAIYYRIYYVYGGEAYCRYKGEVLPLQSGHLYIFPVMTPYTLWHNADKPLEVLWFHTATEICLCRDLQKIQIEETTVLYYLLNTMKVLTDNAEYYEELLEVFGLFLDFLVKEMSNEFAVDHRMQSVIKFIDNHMEDSQLSVDMLAHVAAMDRSAFSKKFKKIFNITPSQYIYGKRMNKAAIALASGASVYQAAGLVGYMDEKSFARAFKRYMEVTPSGYRKYRVKMP